MGIYAVYPENIRVLAFAHQKQRPFYWRKRLPGMPKGESPTTG